MHGPAKRTRIALANLTTPQKMAFVTLSMATLLGLIITVPQIVGPVIVLCTLAVFIKALLSRMWELGHQIRRPLFRRFVRIIGVTRRFFAISPEVEFLHVSTIFLVLISLAYVQATENLTAFNALGQVFLGLVFIAATVDTGRQVVQLTRITWAKTIGKVGLAGVGAALFYVATAFSKQIVHGITATDPKYYSEFSGLFATLAMPVLYLLLGLVVLGTWAFTQLAFAFVATVVGSPLSRITSNVPAWKLFLYRMQHGKRPPQNYCAPKVDFRLAVVWMRPISLILSIVLILSALKYILNEYGESLKSVTVKSLVALEYKPGSRCLGLPPEVEVAYLQNGLISVAKQVDGHFSFSTQKCELPTE